MNKRMNALEEKVMPVADKIANNRYLLAIRDGFMLAMPLLIIGAISLLIEELPIAGYGDFMAGIFGEKWGDFFLIPFRASMAIMTIFVMIGISHSLSNHYKQDSMSAAVVTLVSFFVLTPLFTSFTPEGSQTAYKVGSVIPMEWVGSKGLFVGMLTAILATEIMRAINERGWVIRMPEGVPPTVAKAFSALIPGTITIYTFGIIRLIFANTSYGTIHNFIYTILQLPLTALGDSLGAVLIANFFIGLFWMFGIAGGDVVQSIMTPIWLALSADNLMAFEKGEALPHIITQQFNSIYLWMGGGGATIGLCIALLFVCRSQQCKKIGKLAILPGIFNINEPIIFGLPVVLNPIMLIPFICTPLILAVVTYFSMALGIVPCPNGVVIPWTTPPIIGGFLISGIRGAILQVVEVGISFLVYLPFIKIQDRKYCDQEKLYESSSSVSAGM